MMENFKTRKLDAADYHKDHPYMKSLDKALKQYSVVKVNDANGAHHGPDYEEMRIAILNSLFHPQAVYDKRVESPNNPTETSRNTGKWKHRFPEDLS